MQPHSPPLTCGDLAPIGGKIGPALEHFEVTEVPMYEPSGAGEHHYVWVQKRGFTTPALVRALATAAGVPEREVGYAGLKDKHAVTTQWISLPRTARPADQWTLHPALSVLGTSRHGNKLRVGHLLANKFKIRLVDVVAEALPRAEAIFAYLGQHGLRNYFGAQRFGLGGNNIEQAKRWLEALERTGGRQRGRHFEQRLLPSVLQSEVFNRYLTQRTKRDLTQLLVGEVVRLDGAGAQFIVEDLAKEQVRFDAGDLHLTGPVFGPKMRPAAGEPKELETLAIQSLELSPSALEALAHFAPGTRRDLVVRPSEVALSAPAPHELEVSFTLPSGSYATEVIRQLTHAPFIDATPPADAHGDPPRGME